MLDIIDRDDMVGLQECTSDVWEGIHRNKFMFEQVIERCIERRNIRMLETIVRKYQPPDNDIKRQIFTLFKTNPWMAGYNLLSHEW